MKLLLASLLLVLATQASAQDYRASVLYVAPPDSVPAGSLAFVPPDSIDLPRQPSIALPMLGGAVGGVVGMYGGVWAGASIDPGYDDISPGMVYGLVAGEILMLPIGVHLGNGRKGSFLSDLAASFAIGTGSVLAASAIDSEIPLLFGAAAQYATVVAVERSTAKKRMAQASVLARQPAAPAADSSDVPSPADSIRYRPVTIAESQPGVAAPIIGGIVGAAAGALGGVVVGSNLSDESSNDIPVGAVNGWIIGESIVMPLGVHLGNGLNGSYLSDLGISLVGQLVAVALAYAGPVGYFAGITGQIAVTVANERAVGRKKLERRAQAQAP